MRAVPSKAQVSNCKVLCIVCNQLLLEHIYTSIIRLIRQYTECSTYTGRACVASLQQSCMQRARYRMTPEVSSWSRTLVGLTTATGYSVVSRRVETFAALGICKSRETLSSAMVVHAATYIACS